MSQNLNCRICGKVVVLQKTEREIGNYLLFSCPECKTIMAMAKHSDNSNAGDYNELFLEGEYEMHRKTYELLSRGRIPLEFHRQKLLKGVEKLVQGRNLIEIGGGTGSFGIFCARRGWNYSDYDISPVAVNYATKLGLHANIINDPTHLVLPGADVIAMWEVIEHIWNVNDYLRIIRDSLKNSGCLILSTPNYYRRGYRLSNNWGKISSPPIHVNFFTEESITYALKMAGFGFVRVIKPRYFRPSVTLKSILYNFQIALGIEPTKTLYILARS